MPSFNGEKYEASSPLLHYRTNVDDIGAIQHSLEVAGFVVFPALLGPAHTSALLDEFDKLIEVAPRTPGKITELESIVFRTNPNELAIHDALTTRETFRQSYMHDISKVFFNSPEFVLNEHIFINLFNETGAKPKGAFELHFDQIHTLKFLIYLLDTTVQEGAFRAAPGSHRPARLWRQQQLSDGVKMRDLDDRPHQDDDLRVHSLEGPAGTVIVFDTDTFHSAGRVAANRQRKVIRGHTRSKEMIELVKRQY